MHGYCEQISILNSEKRIPFIMSLGEKHRKEADKILDEGGKLVDAATKYNLAALEFAKEGKKREANQCKILYRLLAGLASQVGAYTTDDVKESIKHYRETRKLLRGQMDQEAQDLLEMTEGMLLTARGLQELWAENTDDSIKLFEKAGQHYLKVKDRVPDFADIAEVCRLEALSEMYTLKANRALCLGDFSSYTVFAGEAKRCSEITISMVNEEAKRLHTGIHLFRKAQMKFVSAIISLGSYDAITARTHLKEHQDLLTDCIEEMSAVKAEASRPRARAIEKAATGLQQGARGLSDYLDASRMLYLGNPQLARKKFERAFSEADNALELLSSIGQWGKPLIPFVTTIRDQSKGFSRSITLAAKHSKRRIAIDASKQFGLLFFISLCTFIILDYGSFLQTAPLVKVYISLVVASVTAFGLNATRLKELFFPLEPYKTTES
jgi:hypothetical protein